MKTKIDYRMIVRMAYRVRTIKDIAKDDIVMKLSLLEMDIDCGKIKLNEFSSGLKFLESQMMGEV